MPFWEKDEKNEVRSEPPVEYRTQGRPKSTGEFAAFRSNTWEPMKVWLPEPVDVALKQLTEDSSHSRSKHIREMLFNYVYGRYAFEQMKAQGDGFFYEEPAESSVMFSCTVNRAPALGKNSINYKVWLPVKLREDLRTLANEAGITLSLFVREALISALLGHITLPERAIVLQQARDTPEDWPQEEGEEEY
jgi:predicted DNA-binding protein